MEPVTTLPGAPLWHRSPLCDTGDPDEPLLRVVGALTSLAPPGEVSQAVSLLLFGALTPCSEALAERRCGAQGVNPVCGVGSDRCGGEVSCPPPGP